MLVQKDAELCNHLQGCDHCARFVATLERLEAATDQLPLHDAPDHLVEKVAAAVIHTDVVYSDPAGSDGAARSDPAKNPAKCTTGAGGGQLDGYRRRRHWASGFATAAVILAAVGLSQHLARFAPSSDVGPLHYIEKSETTEQWAAEPWVGGVEQIATDGLEEMLDEDVIYEAETEPSISVAPPVGSGRLFEQDQTGLNMEKGQPNRSHKMQAAKRARSEQVKAKRVAKAAEMRRLKDAERRSLANKRAKAEKRKKNVAAYGREAAPKKKRQDKADQRGLRGAAYAGQPLDRSMPREADEAAVFADTKEELVDMDIAEHRAERELPAATTPAPAPSFAGMDVADVSDLPASTPLPRDGVVLGAKLGADISGPDADDGLSMAWAKDEVSDASALRGRALMNRDNASPMTGSRGEVEEEYQVTGKMAKERKKAKPKFDHNRSLDIGSNEEPVDSKPQILRRQISRAAMEESVARLEEAPQSPAPPPPGAPRFKPSAPPSQAVGYVARRFLAERASIEGLDFREAAGYWANTYVPGDPAMRLLESRLRSWDRGPLVPGSQPPPLLERAARPNWQPFDAPQNSALALYLHGDRRATDGPSRMLVQVGIKGSLRQSGRRPAMNVGLVVVLRPGMEPGLAAKVRALIMGLEQARQPGDRFSLTLAGQPGGQLVSPGQFRHGPLQVAMGRIFGAEEPPEGPALGLTQAISLAMESVRKGDDPTATLGSSLVLLVSTSPVTPHLGELERLAHAGAVRGISLSMVPLGRRMDLDAIDRLVAAGQGSRRILDSTAKATALMDRELRAASGVVARAVRLRIRLAPGVRLVNVLGSHRLQEPQAQRVREAEQSIDRRMARNLGIQADRGEDEEGIQVVIPNFHAGDAHVVLLDVVVAGPGPVADVSVRYKDVVYLRNGTARANLVLETGEQLAGPLEHNVLKNLLAWRLAVTSRQAGVHLADGRIDRATAKLRGLLTLLRGLRLEIQGWAADAEILNDERMLAEYVALLSTPGARQSGQRQRLADSLRYAGFRRLARTAYEQDAKTE